MMRTYAIGDIHGHLDQLQRLHHLIAQDMALHGAAPIVHVGDLVDRGPNCKGVIDYLMQGQAAGQDWIVLKGNHDRMFQLFLENHAVQDVGLRPDLSYLHPKIGGAATLASYGVVNAAERPVAPVHAEAVAAVPEAHRSYLRALPVSHQRGEVLFVHAGIRPGVALAAQTETDLLWIRFDFLEDTRDHGVLVVHGHTALEGVVVHYGNRLNIDSGAAYGRPLSAVVIEGRDVFQITEQGRVPVLPAIA